MRETFYNLVSSIHKVLKIELIFILTVLSLVLNLVIDTGALEKLGDKSQPFINFMVIYNNIVINNWFIWLTIILIASSIRMLLSSIEIGKKVSSIIIIFAATIASKLFILTDTVYNIIYTDLIKILSDMLNKSISLGFTTSKAIAMTLVIIALDIIVQAVKLDDNYIGISTKSELSDVDLISRAYSIALKYRDDNTGKFARLATKENCSKILSKYT